MNVPASAPSATQSVGAHGGYWRDLVLISVLFILVFGFELGSRAIWSPDEGRYSEIPREMLVSGDFVTPHLDGVKYFEKPPLFYWLQAGAIKTFGLNTWALRLMPTLFTLLACLAVYGAGRRFYGRRAGLWSAAILASSFLFYVLGRVIILDMAVTTLMSAALLAFLVGVQTPDGGRRRLYLWGFYILMALATLTKGLIGIILPGMVIFVWLALYNEWRLLKTLYIPSGLLLFLLVAAPWHILVSLRNPEFPYFYFVQQHFLRYFTQAEQRYQPDWFFIPILLLGLYPWSAFLPQAIRRALPTWSQRGAHKDTVFLLLWAGLIFTFFSLSQSKLVPYILPVFPPLAILIGHYLATVERSAHGLRYGLIALGLLGIAGGTVLIALPLIFTTGLAHTQLQQFPGEDVYLIAGALMGAGIAALLALRLPSVGQRVGVVTVATAALLMIFNHSMLRLDPKWSTQAIAQQLRPQLRDSDIVANYNTYFQDLPVYLERRIVIADWTNELTFGMQHQDTHEWMIDKARLLTLWNSPQRVYLFANAQDIGGFRAEAGARYRVMAENGYIILVTNQPPP
ncbi:MAG: phospholipid carrier-dependent glycosyltransferase [Gammaproteobacteria bacterium]